MKRNKFHAKPTLANGHRFASQKEARRYQELSLLERAGQIKALVPHPAYPLHVNDIFIGRYTADASYFERDKCVVEDVKGGKATRTEAYRLRVKLFKALYPDIEHREIG